MLKRHVSERGSSISNTWFGKVTLMLPITPRMISQDTDYSCFSWFNLQNTNKNKTKKYTKTKQKLKEKQKNGHTTFWNASMLSPWSLLLCLFYFWGGSLPSIAFTDSWVFFWAWVLFTCLDLVSVEKEWGQGGDGRSGSEGKNVFSGRSVGFNWLTNQTGRCVLGRCQTAPKTTVPRMCVCERVCPSIFVRTSFTFCYG